VTTVVIPFAGVEGKTRLHASSRVRREFSLAMLGDVLAAARRVGDVHVVTADPDGAAVANEAEATVLDDPGGTVTLIDVPGIVKVCVVVSLLVMVTVVQDFSLSLAGLNANPCWTSVALPALLEHVTVPPPPLVLPPPVVPPEVAGALDAGGGVVPPPPPFAASAPP